MGLNDKNQKVAPSSNRLMNLIEFNLQQTSNSSIYYLSALAYLIYNTLFDIAYYAYKYSFQVLTSGGVYQNHAYIMLTLVEPAIFEKFGLTNFIAAILVIYSAVLGLASVTRLFGTFTIY